MSQSVAARAGRPRDEAVHRAILEAARELIGELGYGAFSIEAVAARANVAKQSIYRRWVSKGALLVELYMSGLEQAVAPAPNDFARDVTALLTQTVERLQDPAYANILRGLMIEAQTDPALRKLVLEKIVEPRRKALRAVISRGTKTGDLPSDIDVETLLDFVFGAIWFNLLLSNDGVPDSFVDDVIGMLRRFRSSTNRDRPALV